MASGDNPPPGESRRSTSGNDLGRAEDLGPVRTRRGRGCPATRELARRFRLHPNTVSAGYRQLEREQWVEFRRGSGVYVREARGAGERDGTALRATGPMGKWCGWRKWNSGMCGRWCGGADAASCRKSRKGDGLIGTVAGAATGAVVGGIRLLLRYHGFYDWSANQSAFVIIGAGLLALGLLTVSHVAWKRWQWKRQFKQRRMTRFSKK
jgi:hypothetical protein